MKDVRRGAALLVFASTVAACATNLELFHAGPRPSELAGTWIDVEKTTPSDTSAWLLAPDGADRTMHLKVSTAAGVPPHVARSERLYGAWYLQGSLRDTTGRALCFKRRPRDGASCFAFRLDTLAGPPSRRRLTVLGYQGAHHVSARVLVERIATP